jgi:hypothetical protein
MSEDIRKMINKVKNFKQFVNENTQSKKYYGIFNVHGEYNNVESPVHTIALKFFKSVVGCVLSISFVTFFAI